MIHFPHELPVSTALSLIASGVLLASAGCELEERTAPGEAEEIPAARAEPPAAPPGSLGPVFAPPEQAPLSVGDDLWAGPGTVGYELVGEFVSAEALRASLDPGSPVGGFQGRTWLLGDILVAVDFRGLRESATWLVVGPPEVVEGYVERLRESASERSPLRELGVLRLDVQYGF